MLECVNINSCVSYDMWTCQRKRVTETKIGEPQTSRGEYYWNRREYHVITDSF